MQNKPLWQPSVKWHVWCLGVLLGVCMLAAGVVGIIVQQLPPLSQVKEKSATRNN